MTFGGVLRRAVVLYCWFLLCGGVVSVLVFACFCLGAESLLTLSHGLDLTWF